MLPHPPRQWPQDKEMGWRGVGGGGHTGLCSLLCRPPGAQAVLGSLTQFQAQGGARDVWVLPKRALGTGEQQG